MEAKQQVTEEAVKHSVLEILKDTKREPSRPLATRPPHCPESPEQPIYPRAVYPMRSHPHPRAHLQHLSEELLKASPPFGYQARSPGQSSATPSPDTRSSPESSPHRRRSASPPRSVPPQEPRDGFSAAFHPGLYSRGLGPFPGYSPPGALPSHFYPSPQYPRYLLPPFGPPSVGNMFPRVYPLYSNLLPPHVPLPPGMLPSEAAAATAGRRFLLPPTSVADAAHRDFLVPAPTSAFSAATSLKDKSARHNPHAPSSGSPTAGSAASSDRLPTKPTSALLGHVSATRPDAEEAINLSKMKRGSSTGYKTLPYPLKKQNGKIKYECNVCSKTFGQLSNLKVSVRSEPPPNTSLFTSLHPTSPPPTWLYRSSV